MKTNQISETQSPSSQSILSVCLSSCQRLLARIQNAKEAIRAEFSEKLNGQDRLLGLALNEAEALAWQTGYPQLVFATLANEKAEEVASWNARQQIIRRASSSLAMAA